MSDDTDDCKKERKSYGVEKSLRQFLKLETGLGNSSAFRRGHIWNYEWHSDDRSKARPDLIERVKNSMTNGMSFEEAFNEAQEFDRESRGGVDRDARSR